MSQQGKNVIHHFIPTKKPLRAIVTTIVTVFTTVIFSFAIIYILKLSVLSLTETLVFLFIVSTFASAVTAYLTITKTAYAL